MSDFYDREGNPVTMWEWAFLVEQGPEARRVAQTEVTDGISVSTIWLGINHNFHDDGPPMIFETMVFVTLEEPVTVFGHEVFSEGTEMHRWSTEAQALAGHDQVVAELRAQLGVVSGG